MTTISQNAAKAQTLGLNLTGQLSHETVKQLAELWTPEIRFHEQERYHPIDLERLFKVPVEVLASLPEPAREPFLITVEGSVGTQHFLPPVVRNDDAVLLHGAQINGDLEVTPDGTEA